MTTPILYERDGAIARLILNAPETGNAIDQAFSDRLLELVHDCEDDPEVRVVLLTGSGKFFSVGGNVNAFAAAEDHLGRFVRDLTASLHMAMARLANLSKPVVTAVNGPAAGAGVGLSLIGDVVLAADTASFTLAYPKIGLSPDAGATFLLPRLIGLRRTQSMVYLGQTVDAAEAEAIGLVSRTVPAAELMTQGEGEARRIAAMATSALGRTKRLLLMQGARMLEEQLEQEARLIAESALESNASEGIKAFLERRKAIFQ